MSKKAEKKFTPEINLATKEARELYRLRNSFTFKLGIELILSIKNYVSGITHVLLSSPD